MREEIRFRAFLFLYERMVFQVGDHHVAGIVRDGGSLAQFYPFRVKSAEVFETYGGTSPGIALRDTLRALDRQYDNGNVRFLGDLDDAVMEGQKFAGFASRAFRIDGNGDFVSLKKLGCAVNGHHSFSRIFTVDGHETAAADEPAVERDFEVGFLGNKGRIVLPEDVPGNERIEIRAVVTDEEHLLAFRDLVEVDEIVADAHDLHTDAGRGGQKETEEFRILIVFFLRADEKGTDEDEQKVENDGGDKRANQSEYRI